MSQVMRSVEEFLNKRPTSKDAEVIASALKVGEQIKKMSLGNSQIGDADVKALADTIKEIKEITLHTNHDATRSGVIHIAVRMTDITSYQNLQMAEEPKVALAGDQHDSASQATI